MAKSAMARSVSGSVTRLAANSGRRVAAWVSAGDQAAEDVYGLDAGRKQLQTLRLERHAGFDQRPEVAPISPQTAEIGGDVLRALGSRPEELHRVGQSG